MEFLYALLFISGLAFYAIVHLTIPIIIAIRHKTYPIKTLWLIALASSLFGYVVMALVSQEVTLAGSYLSGLFAVISYCILDKYCSPQIRIELFHSADADIREKLKSRREQGELTSTYIKRLIREDIKRD